jgi:molybdopterin-guanine dinucleotide biosynthesis protein
MATQKHRGRNSLVKRLAAQTGSEGMAIALLKKRGHMDDKGKLTAKGRERDDMTAAERAKDRAAKERGGKPSDYTYNPRTNTARKK